MAWNRVLSGTFCESEPPPEDFHGGDLWCLPQFPTPPHFQQTALPGHLGVEQDIWLVLASNLLVQVRCYFWARAHNCWCETRRALFMLKYTSSIQDVSLGPSVRPAQSTHTRPEMSRWCEGGMKLRSFKPLSSWGVWLLSSHPSQYWVMCANNGICGRH